jgi:glycosyltransferase involved in cell wall biosynthesis
VSRHLHFYFSAWTNESRAWRAGTLAQANGYADEIDYVGYKRSGLPDREYRAEGQRILRLGAEPSPSGSSRLRRAMSLPRWFLSCLRESPTIDAKLIVAHGLAALPVSVALARKHRIPLMYDAHELETERAGWSKPIRMIARVVESQLIFECDHVVLVNESIRDWYLAAYPGIDVSVVRNVPEIPSNIGRSSLRQTLNIAPEALVYAYCGALSGDRGLAELIEAFRGFAQDRHLVMIGYGHEKEALSALAQGLANVHFHDVVPQSELVTLLSGADVGIVVLRTDSLSYEYAMPNKLFEYAAARLGVIIGRGPELDRFAREYPASKRAELTVESLRAAICAWSRDEIDRLRPAMAAYTAPSWQTEQRRLLTAYDRAIGNASRRRA